MLDTRFEKTLRTTNPAHRAPQVRTQAVGGFMAAVRQISLAMRPHVFNRIELRSIAGKPENMKAACFSKESLNIRPFMDLSTIPDEDHLFANMAQQIAKKADNFMSGDVMGMKTDVQPGSMTARRYGKTSNGRYFIPAIAVAQDRRASGRSPRFPNKRNKQKSAFIKKREMGPKFSGFFLSGARFLLSIPRLLFRPVATPAFLASGSSIRNSGAAISRPRHLYSESRILFESAVQYVSESIGRWYILRKLRLAAVSSSNPFAADLQGVAVVPISPDFECLGDLPSCTLATTEQLNSVMNPVLSRHLGTFSRSAAWQ
jgi:hypothetical protein